MRIKPLIEFTTRPAPPPLTHTVFHSRAELTTHLRQLPPCPTPLILDCDYSHPAPLLRVASRAHLLATLEAILAGDYLADHANFCLVIANVSTYLWQCRVANDLGFYPRVAALARRIRDKYHCPVALAAWDHTFERGYNQRAAPVAIPAAYYTQLYSE